MVFTQSDYDSIGQSYALKNEHKYSFKTCITEMMDNCWKALLSTKNKQIDIIDNNEIFIIKDNGCGISSNNLSSILTGYKRNLDNTNTLSHYGIGLNASFINILSQDSLGIIISVCNKDNSKKYCLACVIIDTNNMLHYEKYDLNREMMDCIDTLIPETGTIIYMDKISNHKITKESNFDSNETTIYKLVNDFKNKNIFKLIESEYSEEKENVDEDEISVYNYINILWTPLLITNLVIHYNNIKCIPKPFILEEDTHIGSIKIYCKQDEPNTLIIDDFGLKYDLNKADSNFKRLYANEIHNDDNYKKEYIGLLNLYYSKNPDERLKKIQYTVNNNRILQRNACTKRIIPGHLFKYLRINFRIDNEIYLKKYIIDERKTPLNIFDVSDLPSMLFKLNKCFSSMYRDNNLLNKLDWETFDSDRDIRKINTQIVVRSELESNTSESESESESDADIPESEQTLVTDNNTVNEQHHSDESNINSNRGSCVNINRFIKNTYISDELCSFLNVKKGTEMSRTEVTKLIVQYIEDNNLQDKTYTKRILPDKKLSNLINVNDGDELTYFNLQKYMKVHFIKQKPIQKKRGGSIPNGGIIYLWTLKNSKDWTTNDGTIFKFGYTEHDIGERIKQHQRAHPVNKIKLIKYWNVDIDVQTKETEILKRFQDKGLIYNTKATERSEYIISEDSNTLIELIEGLLPPDYN